MIIGVEHGITFKLLDFVELYSPYYWLYNYYNYYTIISSLILALSIKDLAQKWVVKMKSLSEILHRNG